jgi:uncharacterized protein
VPPTETHARLSSDLLTARKSQDKSAILLLGTMLAEVKERVRVIENEEKRAVTDVDVIEVLRKGIKKRRESVEQYGKAGRADLADKEQAEITALETYLPAAVDPAIIRSAVQDAIAGGKSQIGAVMGAVLPRFKGQVDGSVINAIAREELAKVG